MRGGLEPSWNSDISVATLNPQSVFPELYYPLWWYSGSSISTNSQSSQYIQKGTVALSPSSNSSTTFFTLSSNANPNTLYSIEATVWASNTSGGSNLYLVDITSGGATVSGAYITGTSTTATVMRSGTVKLTPGHSYGLIFWNDMPASATVYCTDASLIIFPQAPLTSSSVSSISLANPSGNTLKEAYIPLWVYSSSFAIASTNSGTFGGVQALQKGTNICVQQPFNSAPKLHTLSSNWNLNQKFALEVSLSTQTTGNTAYAELIDMTNSSIISGSLVSITSTSFTLVRSGSFTLTPGHVYGVGIYTSNSSVYAQISKAHLVALA